MVGVETSSASGWGWGAHLSGATTRIPQRINLDHKGENFQTFNTTSKLIKRDLIVFSGQRVSNLIPAIFYSWSEVSEE